MDLSNSALSILLEHIRGTYLCVICFLRSTSCVLRRKYIQIHPVQYDLALETTMSRPIIIVLPFRFYLLGNTGVVAYVQNSPEQKLGVFLAVANSCANPFIFFTFMPSFR